MTELYEPKIALLGTGHIAAAIGNNIIKSGFALVAWDQNHRAATNLAVSGAQIATSPSQAVMGADIIISVLRHDSISREVWFGDANALAEIKPRAVLVACSTLPIDYVRELAAAVDARGGRFIDAPFFGDEMAAREWRLQFLVGGAPDTLTTVREVLEPSGTVTHFGAVGTGTLMKLLLSYLVGINTTAIAQCMALATQAGLDAHAVVDLLAHSTVASEHSAIMSARLANQQFDVEVGGVRRMVRDMSYAVQHAQQTNREHSLMQALLTYFETAQAAGLQDADAAVVFRQFVSPPPT